MSLSSIMSFFVSVVLALSTTFASIAAPSGPDVVRSAPQDDCFRRAEAIWSAGRGQPLVRAPQKPPLGPGRAPFARAYSFSLVEFAARCLWLDESVAAANAALQENADYYLAHPDALVDKDNFHWHSEAVLRLVEFFGTQGSRRAGRLTPETERKVLEAVWLYCRRDESRSKVHTHLAVADDAVSQTWFIKESENHHAQSFTTLWHFAQLARRLSGFAERRYDDGRTPAEHYDAWNRYLKLYFLERARKGLLIEMMSVRYNASLLKGIFNVYDFAEDPEVVRRAGLFLDLYFATWGQEQIDGIAGGGQARIYSDLALHSSDLGYLFFGLGSAPKLQSELITALTTNYRPAPLVVKLVTDRTGLGDYEVFQRPLGLAADPGGGRPPDYRMRTDYGGNLRYSYCTPSFVMGTTMGEARPTEDWTMISSQNRRHGVIFAGSPVGHISPQCEATRDRRAYNTQWAVQKKGTLICQKLRTNRDAGGTRVWISRDGLTAPVEREGWVLVEAQGAFAAVRVVRGGSHFADAEGEARGRWLVCADEYSPIVLQVGEKTEYPTLEIFWNALRERPLTLHDDTLHCVGLAGDRLTFPLSFAGVPTINGQPVDYQPARAFDSPFVFADWNTGIVHLSKGGQSAVLDFNRPRDPE